jgi:hypothetical protein
MFEFELPTGTAGAFGAPDASSLCAGYAKHTLARALPVTRKRHAHMKAALAALASTPRIQREQVSRMTPGKSFRMITQPTKQHLPNPLQCLSYSRLGGSVPSGKGGGL